MNWARPTLILDALAWFGFGVWLFLAPESLEGVGLLVDGALGRVEVRGFYGGLEMGIGAFVLWTAAAPQRYRAGLMLGVLSMAGLATGRLVGSLLEGEIAPAMAFYMAIEYCAAAINAWVLRKLQSRP
jgi:hypothetical protein